MCLLTRRVSIREGSTVTSQNNLMVTLILHNRARGFTEGLKDINVWQKCN